MNGCGACHKAADYLKKFNDKVISKVGTDPKNKPEIENKLKQCNVPENHESRNFYPKIFVQYYNDGEIVFISGFGNLEKYFS
jgi:hypothetical protein